MLLIARESFDETFQFGQLSTKTLPQAYFYSEIPLICEILFSDIIEKAKSI